ncbi:MAG TPA: hypothetical protein VHE35_08095, partial [Kofleriaceae bacterium]|nr:hypothetical protein [Kofleriaceae bacterium]
APGDAGPVAPPATPGDAAITGRPAPPSATRGVPHTATIVTAAVSRHGDAALSLDVAGEARLWTALDGTIPPRRIAVAGLVDPRIERAGDRIAIGAVLPGGLGYLGLHHAGGAAAVEVTLDNVDGDALAVVPTIDATAAVVVRADQSLELYGTDGVRHARVELGRERVRGIVAAGPSAVVAVLRLPDDHYVARRYQVRGDALVADRDVAVTFAPIDGLPLAVSPDGKRLATFRPVGPPPAPAAPTTPPDPAGDRPADPKPVPPSEVPPPPAAPAITVQVVDLATGKDVTPAGLVDHVFDSPAHLGFSADDRLHVNDGAGGVLSLVLTGNGELVTEVSAGVGLLAAGDGVVLGGQSASLMVHHVGGATTYLGYRLTAPRAFALSADGRRLVVAGFDNTAAVETLDGSAPERVLELPGTRPVFVAFLDDQRLIVVDEQRHVSVRDATTGAEQQSITVTDAEGPVVLHPQRTWLFGVRGAGGFWAVPLERASTAPLGKPITVADGGTLLAAVDDGRADGPVVATSGTAGVRGYTAANLTAAGGPKAKKKPPALLVGVNGADEVGHFYELRGNQVDEVDLGGAHRTVTLPLEPDSLTPLPAGGFLVGTSSSVGLAAYGIDGNPRWSLAFAGLGGITANADRSLLALSSFGGVVVLDAASGATRHATCGWGFGAWDTAPADVAGSGFVVCR